MKKCIENTERCIGSLSFYHMLQFDSIKKTVSKAVIKKGNYCLRDDTIHREWFPVEQQNCNVITITKT